MTRTVLLLIVAAAACDAKNHVDKKSDEAPAGTGSSTPQPRAAFLTFEGLGSVRIGATAATLDSIPPASASGAACRLVTLASLPAGVRVMLANDTVARIQVDSGTVRTIEGAGIGDDEAHVSQLYAGRVVTQPNKYDPKGHDLMVTDASDTTRRAIFETDGEKVVRYRVGKRPEVDLVEGCG